MSKAIGMVEYKTVSAGVVAADAMVKTSDVKIIEAQTVCPGKYIVIITGDLSAVDAVQKYSMEVSLSAVLSLETPMSPYSRQSTGQRR